MKGKLYKIFEIIKEMFTVLLGIIVNESNHAKCVFLSNKKCMIQLFLINLHPNEYNQELLPTIHLRFN